MSKSINNNNNSGNIYTEPSSITVPTSATSTIQIPVVIGSINAQNISTSSSSANVENSNNGVHSSIKNSSSSCSKMQSTNGMGSPAPQTTPIQQPRLHPKKRKFDLAELEEIDNHNQSQSAISQCNTSSAIPTQSNNSMTTMSSPLSTTPTNMHQSNYSPQTTGATIIYQTHPSVQIHHPHVSKSDNNNFNGVSTDSLAKVSSNPATSSTPTYNHNINTIITVSRADIPGGMMKTSSDSNLINKKIYSTYR